MTAPTPDAPVEVGAGAFIESVPTPAAVAAEHTAPHKDPYAVGGEADLNLIDHPVAPPARARRKPKTGPDTTHEGDPR